MQCGLPARKRIRLDREVYTTPGTIALLTTCTRDRQPVFAVDHCARIAMNEIRAIHSDGTRVLGYCVMPDHVHLLVVCGRRPAPDVVRAFKGRVAAHLRPEATQVWQRSFHDHVVRRREGLFAVLRYLLENPVRAGLVERWVEYEWSGSVEWPDLSPEFFEIRSEDVVWSEIR